MVNYRIVVSVQLYLYYHYFHLIINHIINKLSIDCLLRYPVLINRLTEMIRIKLSLQDGQDIPDSYSDYYSLADH